MTLGETCNIAHNCSPFATCKFNDRSGSYSCVCVPGYQGDGYSCDSPAGYRYIDPSAPSPDCEQDDTCRCPDGFLYSREVHRCLVDGTRENNHHNTESPDHSESEERNGNFPISLIQQKKIFLQNLLNFSLLVHIFKLYERPLVRCFLYFCLANSHFIDILNSLNFICVLFLFFKVKSRPEVVCYEGKCICPWGYQLWHNDQKCQPKPGALKSNLGIRPSFEPKSTLIFISCLQNLTSIGL
jgi:hypothetical protein